jgi:ubiquinone/menaquinone biosynthesis C-methylase UbiE
MFSKAAARQLARPSRAFAGLLGPIWNRRNRALNDLAFERLELSPSQCVLEVGFGGGYLLGRIASVVSDGFVAGVDGSPALAAAAQRRFRAPIASGRVEVHCGRAEALPLGDGRFTRACSVNSIFYWDDTSRVLSELHRVLQPGGLLVLCFTSRESLKRKDFSRGGIHLYDAADVAPMLEAAGFVRIRASRSSDRHRDFWCVEATR